MSDKNAVEVEETNKRGRRTSGKRPSIIERTALEAEALLKDMDKDEGGDRRRTRSSMRGGAAPAPPPAKKERRSADSPAQSKGTGRRGRPRKNPIPENDNVTENESVANETDKVEEKKEDEVDNKQEEKENEDKADNNVVQEDEKQPEVSPPVTETSVATTNSTETSPSKAILDEPKKSVAEVVSQNGARDDSVSPVPEPVAAAAPPPVEKKAALELSGTAQDTLPVANPVGGGSGNSEAPPALN